MTNKKLSLLLIILAIVGSLSIFNIAVAADSLPFKPNIDIPDSNFVGLTTITKDSAGQYIVDLYKYGAIFVGAVAMFMLVLAGFQWLMAAGSADKISKAKGMINGVLVGLALLFGGQLLMSTISDNLVKFDALDLTKIPSSADEAACEKIIEEAKSSVTCGTVVDTLDTGMACYSKSCLGKDDGKECLLKGRDEDCPSASYAFNDIKCKCVETEKSMCLNFSGCKSYDGVAKYCNANLCLGEENKSGEFITEACYWNITGPGFRTELKTTCIPVDNNKSCLNNSNCHQYSRGDVEYCCSADNQKCTTKTTGCMPGGPSGGGGGAAG